MRLNDYPFLRTWVLTHLGICLLSYFVAFDGLFFSFSLFIVLKVKLAYGMHVPSINLSNPSRAENSQRRGRLQQ